MFRVLRVVSIIVIVGYLSIHALLWAIQRIGCHIESVESVANLHGLDFEVTEAGCGLIGVNWETAVHVSRTGRWNGSDIFIYDPAFFPPQSMASVPEFSVSDDGDITITVQEVDEILVQKFEWEGIHIHYKIGRIDYPTAPPPSSAPR